MFITNHSSRWFFVAHDRSFLVWFPHNGPQGSSTPTKDMDFCGANQSLHSHINTCFCRCSWKDVIIVILSFRGGAKFAHSTGLWVYESWSLFLILPLFLQINPLAFVYLFINTVFFPGTCWGHFFRVSHWENTFLSLKFESCMSV